MTRGDVEARTGELYSDLFGGFTDDEYAALAARFGRRVAAGDRWFEGRRCLDAGVGSGRALTSMARLGAGMVVGIDVGDGNLRAASRRTAGAAAVRLLKASVLALPFRDRAFDFVHCSGVLHHTPSAGAGFRELARCLRTGGLLSIGVYGKGGLLSGAISLARLLVRPVPFRWIRALVSRLPISPISRADILDYLYVPIQTRHTESEVRGWFDERGFGEVRRVAIEKYDHTRPLSRLLRGEGWIQMQGRKVEGA
ncbi:MAG: class I SAM-dependent methyltransferase [bacterium]|nr:class I SAM-dependent methyltransferase [bacterium]